MGLSLKETEKLLHFVEGIRAAGKSAIFIDHNIFHVYSVADRIVVLDRGRVAGEFPTSRYSLEELMDIMREVAAGGAYTEAERYRRRSSDPAPARREVSRERPAGDRRAAERPIGVAVLGSVGVADRHHRRRSCCSGSMFIVLAPRTFLDSRHLPLVRPDDAVLRDRGHAPDDGHRGRRHRSLVRVDHGPGDGRLRRDLAVRPGSVELGIVAALAIGVMAGLFNGADRDRTSGSRRWSSRSAPSSCTAGLALVLVSGRQFPLVTTQSSPLYDVLVGKLFGIPMEFVWLVLIAIAHVGAPQPSSPRARTPTSIGDNRPGRPRSWASRSGGRGSPCSCWSALAAAFAGLLNSFQVVNFYPASGRRLPAADPRGGVRRRDLGVRWPRQRVGDVHRRVHDRRDQRRARRRSA